MTAVLGIDIGGSGIKGALVDLDKGALLGERVRILTPKKSTPQACAQVCAQIVKSFASQLGDAPVGVTVPAPVLHGLTPFIANLDRSWQNASAEAIFRDIIKRPVTLLNDADAAGVAEMEYGAGKNKQGVVIMTTLGTGIGSAIFHDGVLLPNIELGHIEIDGHDAESRASAGYKDRVGMSYKRWAKRLQVYYSTVEKLFWPDLFIVGGGVSKDHEKFLPLLQLRCPIVPAKLFNQAGIVGAAWYAADRAQQ